MFHHEGTLQRIRYGQPDTNPAYHANLDKLDTWLPWAANPSPRRHHLIREVRMMLSKNPDQRPTVDEVLSRIVLCDTMMNGTKTSIFGDCCRTSYVTTTYHLAQLRAMETKLQHTRDLLQELAASATRTCKGLVKMVWALDSAEDHNDQITVSRPSSTCGSHLIR